MMTLPERLIALALDEYRKPHPQSEANYKALAINAARMAIGEAAKKAKDKETYIEICRVAASLSATSSE